MEKIKRSISSFGFDETIFNDIGCMQLLAHRVGMHAPTVTTGYTTLFKEPSITLKERFKGIIKSLMLQQLNHEVTLYFNIYFNLNNDFELYTEVIHGEDNILNFIENGFYQMSNYNISI
jgi:hypothetical protein